MNGIMTHVADWFGSVAGFITVLIVMICAGRIALTLLREKYGQESTRYRMLKGIPTIVCVIYVVNMIAHFCGAAATGIGSTATSVVTTVAETKWLAVAVWILSYILLMGLSGSWRCTLGAWLATIVAVMGSYALWQNVTATVIIGIVALIVVCCFVPDSGYAFFPRFRRKHDANNANDAGAAQANSPNDAGAAQANSPKRGLLFGILWAASLVMAYLAGEYSLIPRALEFLNNKLNQKTAAKEAESEEEASIPITPAKQPTA